MKMICGCAAGVSFLSKNPQVILNVSIGVVLESEEQNGARKRRTACDYEARCGILLSNRYLEDLLKCWYGQAGDEFRIHRARLRSA